MHTPGPWQFGESNESKLDIHGADNMLVATVLGGIVSNAPKNDNASLIKAAPDLVEALKRIAQGIEGGQSFSGTDCAEIARAALAKVVG